MEQQTAAIDLDFYEKVIIYHCLTDESYLGTIIEYIDSDYFTDKCIKDIIRVVVDFHRDRDQVPTLTEIKARLVTTDLVDSFKVVVEYIKSFDQKFNKDELYSNTEQFFNCYRFSPKIKKSHSYKVVYKLIKINV